MLHTHMYKWFQNWVLLLMNVLRSIAHKLIWFTHIVIESENNLNTILARIFNVSKIFHLHHHLLLLPHQVTFRRIPIWRKKDPIIDWNYYSEPETALKEKQNKNILHYDIGYFHTFSVLSSSSRPGGKYAGSKGW